MQLEVPNPTFAGIAENQGRSAWSGLVAQKSIVTTSTAAYMLARIGLPNVVF